MTTLASLTVDLLANSAQFRKELKSANKKAGEWAGSVSASAAKVGTAMAASAAVAATGMTALYVQQSRLINENTAFADQIGISTEALAGLQYAGKLSGVATDTVSDSLKTMVELVSEATEGTGEASEALARLGLSADALNQMSPEQQIMVLADAMGGLENRSDQLRTAIQLFGDEGSRMISVLDMGADGIRAAMEETERYGTAIDRVDAAKLFEANQEFTRTGEMLRGAILPVMIDMAPIVGAIADEFLTAAEEAGGLGNIIGEVAVGGARAMAVLADSVRGWEFIWHGVGLIIEEVMYAAVYDMTVVDEAITDLLNKVPGVNAEYNQTLQRMTREMYASLEKSRSEYVDLVNEPLPSESLEQFIVRVQSAATEKGKAIAATVALRTEYQKLGTQAAETANTIGSLDWQNHLREMGDEMANLERAAIGWTDSFTDAMTDMVMTGKLNFASLAESIIADLIRIQIQSQITKPLAAGLGSFFDGMFGGTEGAGTGTAAASTPAGVQLHTGGIVGLEGQARGLGASEVPAVLQKGEGVFTRGQMASLAPVGSGNMVVNIYNESGSQVEAKQSTGANGMKQLDIMIRERVRQTITEDISRGQGVASAFQNTYGLSRRA